MLGEQPELRVRGDDPVGERTGDRDELEDRAGLVGVRDGAVLLGCHVTLAEAVEPLAHDVGHGEHLARAWVHDDGDRRLAAGVAQRLLEHVLRVELDLAVQGEAHVLARLGVVVRDGLQSVSGGVAHDGLAADLARELLVVEELHAGDARVLRTGEAEDLGRRGLERIRPLLLGVAADARQVERHGRIGELRVDLARDVHEPQVVLLPLCKHVFHVPAGATAVDLQRVAELVGRGCWDPAAGAGPRTRSAAACRRRARRRSCRGSNHDARAA